jgi:predicted phosphodiesterase
MSIIQVISDPHLPFEHPDLLDFHRSLHQKMKPDAIVCMGDMMDQYALGKWARHPNANSVGDEIAFARAKAKVWFKAFPNLNILIGNHEKRIYKRGLEAGIPEEMLLGIPQLLESPRTVKWFERVVIDNILFFHADGYSGQAALINLIQQFRCNVVIGHLHSLFGVQYLNNGHETAWAACFGCGVDPSTYAFQYSKNFKHQPIIGGGVIIDNVPVPVPMQLDKHGRWTGVV